MLLRLRWLGAVLGPADSDAWSLRVDAVGLAPSRLRPACMEPPRAGPSWAPLPAARRLRRLDLRRRPCTALPAAPGAAWRLLLPGACAGCTCHATSHPRVPLLPPSRLRLCLLCVRCFLLCAERLQARSSKSVAFCCSSQYMPSEPELVLFLLLPLPSAWSVVRGAADSCCATPLAAVGPCACSLELQRVAFDSHSLASSQRSQINFTSTCSVFCVPSDAIL